LDETFGLIETAEKAATIYLKIAHLPILNTITDEQMRQTAEYLHLTLRPGFLDQ
jgi:rhamnulose-1-phosphate aldolase